MSQITEQNREQRPNETLVNGQNCWELCPMCEGTTRVITHIDDDGANLADCWVCAGKGIISKHNGRPPAN